MSLLLTFLTDLLKAVLPELLDFAWEKAHENTTVQEASNDPARRDRLLAAIRLRQHPGGDDPNHPTPPTR
jgi:hypothetical protein